MNRSDLDIALKDSKIKNLEEWNLKTVNEKN
jgi:hypothetical protein